MHFLALKKFHKKSPSYWGGGSIVHRTKSILLDCVHLWTRHILFLHFKLFKIMHFKLFKATVTLNPTGMNEMEKIQITLTLMHA